MHRHIIRLLLKPWLRKWAIECLYFQHKYGRIPRRDEI